MSEKIYTVTLTKAERDALTALVTKGKGNARRLRRAQILLMADEAQEGGCDYGDKLQLKKIVF